MTGKFTLFLSPFKAEARLLAAILPDCHAKGNQHWQFNGGEIFTWNGAGPEKMFAALNSFADLAKFSRLVLFGAAGALNPILKIGQLFSASSARFEQQEIEATALTGFGPAKIVSVKEPVMAAEKRLLLFSQSGAAIVDMESFFFIEKFQNTDCEAYVIRFISDTASTPFKLPFSEEIIQQMRLNKKLFS